MTNRLSANIRVQFPTFSAVLERAGERVGAPVFPVLEKIVVIGGMVVSGIEELPAPFGLMLQSSSVEVLFTPQS